MRYEHLNGKNASIIQQCSTVIDAFICAMLHRINSVFCWSSIGKIVGFRIVSIPIKMADYASTWSWAKECTSNKRMNGCRFLSFINLSLEKAYAWVNSCRVYFSNEPFTVLNPSNSSKIANFVNSFISLDWKPQLRSVLHEKAL